MKKYEKPVAERINLQIDEEIATDISGPSMNGDLVIRPEEP